MTTERWTDESLDRFAATVTTAIAASNDRLTRTEQIVASNARAIQALGEDIAEMRLSMHEGFERSEQNWARASQAIEKANQAIEGVANLMASLDSDRPTILRKLNAIENKVDRILEREDRPAS